MSSAPAPDCTGLLRAWGQGDRAALDHLMPLVHDELRRIASRYMRRERPGNSLQTTALVNEAYLRLIDVHHVEWRDRAHFFAISARMMRRILVDHARARGYQKRGGGAQRVSLEESVMVSPQPPAELVKLDEALTALSAQDHRKARVVELRFFGGLSVEETAAVLNVAPQTVLRDWSLAKSWLAREMKGKKNEP